LIGTAATGGNGFAAERVTDAEIGAKFQGYVAGMPARLNVAFFHDWEENSQRYAITLLNFQSTAVTANVPKGTVYGVEADGQIKPVKWLALGATGAYTRGEFSGTSPGATAIAGCQGATVVANSVASCFDQVPDTPKLSGTIYGDITIPLTNYFAGTVHADVYHQLSATISPSSSNSAGTTLPAYTTADFGMGIESDKGRWSITANLKNAFNKVYYIGGIPTGEILQLNTLIPGQPRTFTIQGRVRF
jgi:iron complex outermembrane receptor protein